MTEEKQNRISELTDTPPVKRALVYQMVSSHIGGIYLNTPESDGFPANRFEGRLHGYMYALVCDRIKTEADSQINLELVAPYATEEELVASKREVLDALKADGLAEKGASLIVKEVVKFIRSERIKGSFTTFFKGLAFLIVGLLITGISLIWAVAWGNKTYIVTYGIMVVGGIYMFFALVSFIRALCFKR